MSATIHVFLDPGDVRSFTDYLKTVERRMARSELLPILSEHFEPIVESEKEFLSGHRQSGALETSLVARSGPGDKPGTITVFSAPTATTAQLNATWGARGRAQQRKWAGGLKKRGRTKVFYGPIVHQGHRVVRNGRDVGYVEPIPYAKQAVDSLGDQQAEAAATAILAKITG